MKRRDVPAEVWIAHRKERKKIASAKWYAAKKRAEIRAQREKRRELEASLQAQKRQCIWSDEERASWRCVLEHVKRRWPCRPAQVPALDWCHMMDLTDECIEQMHIDWCDREDQLVAVRHLCMREFRECYEASGGGLENIRERIRNRSSPVAHHNMASTASHSAWESTAAWLTGGWFPFVCTGVGLLFVQLAVLGQLRHWPELVRHMYHHNEQPATITKDQQNGDNPPHTSPPHQNPMHNPCLNDPQIQAILEAMKLTLLRPQQQQEIEDDLDDLWTTTTSNSDEPSSSYFSCSLPSSLDTLS